jgi:hypothetical protein
MMNKILFSLLLCSLFVACQDTPKNTPDTAAPIQEAKPTPPNPALDMKTVSDELAGGIKMAEAARKQVDALPDKVKKANAAEIEGFQSTLEGVIEKQTMMLNEVKSAGSPAATGASSDQAGATALTPAQVQDYHESAFNYAKEVQNILDAVAKMKKG